MKRFAELNREELRAIAPKSLAVLPIGATEQHGPHLATGMDYFTVESIAIEAAAIAAREISIVVAPALPYGSSHHHLVFGGTLSLTTETYRRVLYELVECLAIDGFKNIFLLNGHGGNQELMQLAVRDIVLTRDVRAAAGSYWNIAKPALLEAGITSAGFPGHAGEFETSVMMSLRHELVSPNPPHRDGNPAAGLSPLFRDERHGFWKGIDGYTDSPDLANAENGARYRKVIAEAVGKAWIDYMRP